MSRRWAQFQDVIDGFVRANPDVPRRRVMMALYFLHGAFIHILSQVRAIERVMADEDEPLQGANDVLDELARFFAHGIGDPASAREEAGSTRT